jgi:hypothetical protein
MWTQRSVPGGASPDAGQDGWDERGGHELYWNGGSPRTGRKWSPGEKVSGVEVEWRAIFE